MWVVGCPLVSDGAPAQAAAPRPQEEGVQPGDQPDPVLPDWEGPCLQHVVPTLLGELAHPGRTALPGWFPEAVAGAETGRAPRDRRTRRGAAPGARPPRPRTGQRCRGTHHLGGPEHHGVRPDHARHGEGAGRARRGRLPGRHRRRRHERAPVVAPGCGRSYVGAAIEVPAVRVVSRCARSRPGGDPARLRADRVHRRAPGPAGVAPLAHAGGAGHRRPRADRPAALRSSTPTTKASTRWPTPRGWAGTTTTRCGRSIASSVTSWRRFRPGRCSSSRRITGRSRSATRSSSSVPRSWRPSP